VKKILLLILVLLSFSGYSQEDNFLGSSLFYFSKDGILNISSLENTFGKDNIVIDDQNIKISQYLGSPLLFEEWLEAEVLFDDAKRYRIPYVNYDAIGDHFIIYVKNLSKEVGDIADKKFPIIGLKDESIINISLSDKNGIRNFIKITPEHFNVKPKTVFFEYFSENPGKVYIVKNYYKTITRNKLKDMPYSDTPEEFVFKTYQNYFIKNPDGIFVIKSSLGKKKVFRILNDKSNENKLKAFIKKRKLRMSNPVDVQKLLEYYYDELIHK
jgi:hypothetical protein